MASDIFAKIGDIKGESLDDKHKGEIEILSWSWGVTQSGTMSHGGGTEPRWRGDGRELFYLAPNGKMMAVEVTVGEEFHAGTPTPLFQAPPGVVVGDVTADGKRFLLVTPVGPSASVPFTVVLNWSEELKQRVPTK